MAGDLVTTDWQIEYDGLLLGDGTAYSIANASGFLELPDLVTADRSRLRRDGLLAGDDFMGGRALTVTLEIDGGTNGVNLDSLISAFTMATRPGRAELPLVFQLPGVAGGDKRQIEVRPRRRQLPLDLDFYYGLPRVTVEFFATDPRLYDASLQSVTTTLPSAGGGLNFNVVPNFTFGAVSVGGTITGTNSGSVDTWPTFRIDGPVTNPRIENVTQSKSLLFNITLATGEYLIVDSEARTVLLNGTASRYSTLDSTSQWWALQPGADSVRFQASTSTVATLNMSWRSAWA